MHACIHTCSVPSLANGRLTGFQFVSSGSDWVGGAYYYTTSAYVPRTGLSSYLAPVDSEIDLISVCSVLIQIPPVCLQCLRAGLFLIIIFLILIF